MIRKGETLYTLETKEHHALSNETAPSTIENVPVKAGTDGIVTAVMQQKGSYVAEGTIWYFRMRLDSQQPYKRLWLP